jgi:hypothetical protein
VRPVCFNQPKAFSTRQRLYLTVQQTVAVLREHRMVPRRVVHAETDEAAEQQVLIDLLDKPTLRPHGKQHLQQQSLQQILGSDRGRP